MPVVPAIGNFGSEVQYDTHQRVLAAYDVGQIPDVDAFVTTGDTFTLVANISGSVVNYP